MRGRGRWTAVVAAAVVVAVGVAGWLWPHGVDPDTPHGHPDPGGRRLAFVEHVARLAVPASATMSHLSVHPFRWDHGGCDGGAAGWTLVTADARFGPATASSIDAAMRSQDWTVEVLDRHSQATRRYLPQSNRYDSAAWLFRDGRSWELDVSARPAELLTHEC